MSSSNCQQVARQQTQLLPVLRRGHPEAGEETQDFPDAPEKVSGRGKEGHREEPPEPDRDPGVESPEEGVPLPVRRLPGQAQERGQARAGRAYTGQ